MVFPPLKQGRHLAQRDRVQRPSTVAGRQPAASKATYTPGRSTGVRKKEELVPKQWGNQLLKQKV